MDENWKRSIRKKVLRGLGKEKSFEEKKLLKQKSREKRASRKSRGPRARDWSEWDEEDEVLERTRGEAPRHGVPVEPEPPVDAGGSVGLVVGVSSGRARVRLDGGDVDAVLVPALAVGQQTLVAVGDEAVVDTDRRVVAIRERRSRLARLDPADPRRERVIAANVDVAVLVVSAASPPFKPGLVDRMLVAVARGGVAALVCINKVDLAGEREERAVRESIACWSSAGIACVTVSATTGAGVDALASALAGKTCVFVGHSGVGKSSLLNALDPDVDRATGRVRSSDGKGRHTTTASSLVELACGTRVIDTPGVRTFGLGELSPAELAEAFPDVAALAAGCRFRDCRHAVEPECAVRAAVERGELAGERHASWSRLLSPET